MKDLATCGIKKCVIVSMLPRSAERLGRFDISGFARRGGIFYGGGV